MAAMLDDLDGVGTQHGSAISRPNGHLDVSRFILHENLLWTLESFDSNYVFVPADTSFRSTMFS